MHLRATMAYAAVIRTCLHYVKQSQMDRPVPNTKHP